MGIIGKMIGGAIGFAIGGPLGAIAGASFGHAYDRTGNMKLKRESLTSMSSNQNAQLTFFVAVFSMLAKIAKADGKVSDREIQSVQQFMNNDLNLDPQSKNMAMTIFREAVNSPQDFESFALQFYESFKMQPRIIELMIDIFIRVSIADGSMTQNEEKLILSAVKIFHFGESRYEAVKARYVKNTGKYYAILDCKNKDSNEHIKKQYRKLVQDYHPDKIASKGLPEEFTKFANDKFREINEAYEKIKKERSI